MHLIHINREPRGPGPFIMRHCCWGASDTDIMDGWWDNLQSTVRTRTVTLGLSLNQHQPFLLPPHAWTFVTMTSHLDRCQPRAAGPLGTTHSRSHSSSGFRDITDATFSLPPSPEGCTHNAPGGFLPHLLCCSSDRPICCGAADGRSPGPGTWPGAWDRDRTAVTILPEPCTLGKNELHFIPISYKLPSTVAVSPGQ